MALFNPLPRTLALTRLKSNLFLLLLSFLFRSVFTPYLTLRRGLIWIVDERLDSRFMSNVFWVGEHFLTFLLLWNIVEAAYSLYLPPPAKSVIASKKGLTFTPSKPSSPLTRSYTPDRSSPFQSTPTRFQPRLSTPTATPHFSTPGSAGRSSPLSASTAKILNLPRQSTSQTGLFYDPNDTASPSRAAGLTVNATQTQAVVPTTTTTTTTSTTYAPGGDFVMVERAESEWVDNVWKGVKGKGGRVGDL